MSVQRATVLCSIHGSCGDLPLGHRRPARDAHVEGAVFPHVGCSLGLLQHESRSLIQYPVAGWELTPAPDALSPWARGYSGGGGPGC